MSRISLQEAVATLCAMFPETDREVVIEILNLVRGNIDLAVEQLIKLQDTSAPGAGEHDVASVDLPSGFLSLGGGAGSPPAHARNTQLNSDEELARRLQEEENRRAVAAARAAATHGRPASAHVGAPPVVRERFADDAARGGSVHSRVPSSVSARAPSEDLRAMPTTSDKKTIKDKMAAFGRGFVNLFKRNKKGGATDTSSASYAALAQAPEGAEFDDEVPLQTRGEHDIDDADEWIHDPRRSRPASVGGGGGAPATRGSLARSRFDDE